MKKIGIICNLMTSYGGVQTCVISLIKGLNQKGIVPILLSNTIPNPKLWEEQGLRCNVKKVKFSISSKSFYKYRKLLFPIWEFVFYFKTSWLKDNYDYVYIFQPNVIVDNHQKHLFYLSMSPRAHGFSKNKFTTSIKNKFYNIFLKRIHPVFEFQNYNCVINSQYTADMFYEYYGKKLDVIYPSNAIEDMIPSEIHKKEKTVVFLSRLAPDKKVEKVIDLAYKFSDYTFYIVGTTSDENVDYIDIIKKEISKRELTNIEFVLNKPYSVVIKYLSIAEYYVFFAQNEHFGITTVEAILMGCIPFVHNSGGQKEIVTQDNLKFEYHNMINMFNELLVINDKEKKLLRMSLSQQVQQFKEEVFINRMVKYIV